MRERNPVSGVLGVAVGAKKPGFFCGYQELSVKCEKETRFLGLWGWLLGQRNRVSATIFRLTPKILIETRFLGFWGWLLGERNRVSVVGIRSCLWVAKKKPGFWGSGVAVGAKKPGFWGGYHTKSGSHILTMIIT